jgi:hypothetical protein
MSDDSQVKGQFPYDKMTEENYHDELMKKQPLERKDFYNSLKKE